MSKIFGLCLTLAIIGPWSSAARADDDPTSCPECRRPCHVHGGAVAAVRGFNCTCKGSYKFPVFPQYTYFWPGMYSQPWMTQYQDPYRFPPLNLPEGYAAKPSPAAESPLAGDRPVKAIRPAASSAEPQQPAP
jgi:hypothetical protein